jgi:hypothetical protein
MLDVMQRLYPDTFSQHQAAFTEMMPGYGQKLNEKPTVAKRILAQTAKTLKLKA